jgi:Domain of unknown function (DUF4397)
MHRLAWRSSAASALAVISLGLAAACLCSPAQAAVAAQSAPATHAVHGGHGWLRLAHLSPNTPPVDVYLYAFGKSHAMIVLKHVAYGTVSPYERVRAGDYTVAMRAAGAKPSSKPVLSTSVDILAGHAYTVAGMGPFKALRLQVMRDRLSTPSGKALVQVIQASLQQHQVTISAGRTVLASKLPFGTATSFITVSPGARTLLAAGPSEHAHARVWMPAGSISTVVVLDDPGHLTVRVLEDAAGAANLPTGAPETGFGGTAAQPGPALLPWLAAVLAGLLLAVAGTARLHRRIGKHAR